MRRFLRLLTIGIRTGEALVVAISLYQTAITAVGYRSYLRKKGVSPELPDSLPRFGLIVCARNEEAVIGRIVRDLLAQDYPVELRDVLVIAHNCSDGTARAAASAGGTVVELSTKIAGKAEAIEAGMAALGSAYDFIGVFDADFRVPEDFLGQIASHSRDEDCLQAEVVPIADADWLAEGYGFGRRARNLFWWRPREALRLSTTISGSGWFIRPEVFAKYSTDSWTLTEDLELSARLVADGHRVAYVSRAAIACGEPRELRASLQQRSRWVRGHIGVVKGRWLPLAGAALRGNASAADMAIYLVAPTRLLTRLGVSTATVLGLFVPALRLPAGIVWLALAGEWVVPGYIGWREKLVRLSTGSLDLALRHSMLSLLWFPIGIWAMATARLRAWHAMPRIMAQETNHVG